MYVQCIDLVYCKNIALAYEINMKMYVNSKSYIFKLYRSFHKVGWKYKLPSKIWNRRRSHFRIYEWTFIS